MTPTEKDDLLRNVVRLEDLMKNPRYRNDLKWFFHDVLKSLMAKDGYDTIIEPRTSRLGFDYICQKRTGGIIAISFEHNETKITTEHILYLISTVHGFPFNRGLFIGLGGFTSDCYQIVKDFEPACVELLDLNDIKNWVSRIEVETDLSKLEYENIIKIVSKAFIEKIATDPDFLLKIEWRELEKTLAEIFEGLAFKVKLTPPSKDGGKDLILEMIKEGSSISYIVEVKHWRSMQRVGQNSVKEFLNVICKEKRESGVFLSTYGFTENAFEGLTELERTKVKFGTKEKIISLCKTYLRVRSGIWTPLQDLQELLFEETN